MQSFCACVNDAQQEVRLEGGRRELLDSILVQLRWEKGSLIADSLAYVGCNKLPKLVNKYVMSPPIRASGHNKALQAAISTGVLQLVGTDHCTFTSTQKGFGIDDFRKIPNGVNGIEERMHLVWDTMVESGKISATDYVRLTSTECARIFNIYPRKGAILAGSDADIIILNPNSSFEITTRSHHSRVDTNVYEGMKGKGKVEVTIAGGKIVWENDELKVVPGSGKYIEMPPFSDLFDGIEKADAKYLSSLQAPVKRLKSTT
ncbi:hypothetical protein JRO89_XS10G0095900 [Xanthoceras sorbifolium]|uniref:dihydropyrimidinase n=1 Tax=Xanthoceras sorbifolium TaxID=99658 RepID=A0ABQ8HID0_9ROSI|nr:hypothetical protein JRO89_XS10G0095900 [Xanthoceras sorbifolium]